MKVKMLFSCDGDELEKQINEFIEEIEKQRMEVKDIKYIMTDAYGRGIHYSALIMYGPDGKIYLDPIPFRYEESN